MPRIQPILHQAMRMILLDAPAQTATLQYLSEENAQRDLYRKHDGHHPLPSQFWVRARKYPAWFDLLPPNKVKYIGSCEQVAAPIDRSRIAATSHPDIEKLQHSFLPPRITTLFIGESSPPGGTFFYSGNSILYWAMKEAFGGSDDFLAEFKLKGFFLDDLVLFPTDKITKEQQKSYLTECQQKNYRDNIESAAQRIIAYRPQGVVILLRRIEIAVLKSVEKAKAALPDLPPQHYGTTPFPIKRRGRHEQFLEEMRRMIPTLPVLHRD